MNIFIHQNFLIYGILCTHTEIIFISLMWYTASTYSCAWYFCLLLHMKLCCLLSASIREGFLISSVECPWHCLELCMQYNLCIMHTLEPFICVLIIRVSMIIQVSLQIHAKHTLGPWLMCGLCRSPYFQISWSKGFNVLYSYL